MAFRKLEIYGSPVLRRKANPVKDFGLDLKELVQDMMDTVTTEEGAGLAAPQVGKSVRVIILSLPQEGQPPLMQAMINPEILEGGGECEYEEGCLSIPGIRENVTRPAWIRVRYQDLKGQYSVVRAEGIMARVVQHEVDHLDGILFVDRLSVSQRSLLSGKLKEISREHQRTPRS
jgi:peptide deformylase